MPLPDEPFAPRLKDQMQFPITQADFRGLLTCNSAAHTATFEPLDALGDAEQDLGSLCDAPDHPLLSIDAGDKLC